KQALGRGLSALLPTRDEVPRGTREVEIDRLVPSRFQPRRDFAGESLEQLAASIREQGIVQPIVVVPRGDKFEIVAGERRWRAAALAGLARVPVVVREKGSDKEMLEIALVENLQREDLNPLEAAAAYARLREEFDLTQEEVARRVGKDRATIANALRLLKLPSSVREKIRDGSLTAGHAKALAGLASADDQEGLAVEILRRALSVRQTEKRVASILREPKITRSERRDPFTRDAEEKLSRRLATRVHIVRRRRGGKIEIAFGSEEELIGLYERLSGKS
ncbi:MAG TPA: ParB/RepB/Spo0J family partition protein, partial [Thermoanaerobaculia bacterium]|nr:ParB/RepB/Spo0J family partition protein [Thermoanaerobaculia bacterium]